MKILNKEEEKSYESNDESSLYEDDLIQEYDIEEEEDEDYSQEEVNEEEILEEVLKEQEKEGDDKMINQLKEIREQYNRILEKIDIHKDILREIKESEESKQIQSIDQLKYTNKTLVESDIKLERMLNGLDSLVGASEQVRPLKKKLVQEIQKTISEIEEIKSNELKSIQIKVDNFVQIKSQNQKQKLPSLKKENQDVKKNKSSPSPSSPILEQTYQPIPNEITNLFQQIKQINLQKQQEKKEQQEKLQQQLYHQKNQQEREQNLDEMIPFFKLLQQQTSQKFSSKIIKVRNIEEEEKERGFPFPLKEDWEKVRFVPNFEIQRTRNSYLISSKISGLNVENISVEADEGILSIKGSKYPTIEEQHYLARELINSIGKSYLLERLTREQIKLAFLKLGSQYNFGNFSVKYELPPNTSVGNIDATYRNGVLQIQLPIENSFNKNSLFSQRNYRSEIPFYGFQNDQQQNNFWDFL